MLPQLSLNVYLNLIASLRTVLGLSYEVSDTQIGWHAAPTRPLNGHPMQCPHCGKEG